MIGITDTSPLTQLNSLRYYVGWIYPYNGNWGFPGALLFSGTIYLLVHLNNQSSTYLVLISTPPHTLLFLDWAGLDWFNGIQTDVPNLIFSTGGFEHLFLFSHNCPSVLLFLIQCVDGEKGRVSVVHLSSSMDLLLPVNTTYLACIVVVFIICYVQIVCESWKVAPPSSSPSSLCLISTSLRSAMRDVFLWGFTVVPCQCLPCCELGEGFWNLWYTRNACPFVFSLGWAHRSLCSCVSALMREAS